MVGKESLTDREIKQLKSYIKSYLNRNVIAYNLGKWMTLPKWTGIKNMDTVLGLAYTSSSSIAGLWVCNLEIAVDPDKVLRIQGFGYEVSGRPVAIIHHSESEDVIYLYI